MAVTRGHLHDIASVNEVSEHLLSTRVLIRGLSRTLELLLELLDLALLITLNLSVQLNGISSGRDLSLSATALAAWAQTIKGIAPVL